MALRNSVSASASVAIGLTLIVSAFRGHGPVPQPPTAIAPPAAAVPPNLDHPPGPVTPSPTVASAAPAPPGIDRSLPTGSLPRNPGLVKPNPAAYADTAKAGSPLVLTGTEAINYLAGNTLRREGPGEPLHFTYFASRGLTGDGDARGFVARAWDRNRADLCEGANDGKALCRPIRILLDARAELAGARLGTVAIGDGATAVLIKGNVLKFPEHIPYLDSVVGSDNGPGVSARRSAAGWQDVVGHPVTVAAAGGGGRRTLFYGKDNRVFELAPVEGGAEAGKAVKITVGHWRMVRTALCETRQIGDANPACFRIDPVSDSTVTLDPTGKAGEALTLRILPETGTRAVAHD